MVIGPTGQRLGTY